MSMEWDYISELRPLMGQLSIPEMTHEYGESWWNNIDRETKKKNVENNLFQCHFVHHKYRMDWPGLETGPPRYETSY
jgi:hypothetical protein